MYILPHALVFANVTLSAGVFLGSSLGVEAQSAAQHRPRFSLGCKLGSARLGLAHPA